MDMHMIFSNWSVALLDDNLPTLPQYH